MLGNVECQLVGGWVGATSIVICCYFSFLRGFSFFEIAKSELTARKKKNNNEVSVVIVVVEIQFFWRD